MVEEKKTNLPFPNLKKQLRYIFTSEVEKRNGNYICRPTDLRGVEVTAIVRVDGGFLHQYVV